MAKNDSTEFPGMFDNLPDEAPQEQIGRIALRNWRAHLASVSALDKRIEKILDAAVKQTLSQGKKLSGADIGRLFQRHPELRAALNKSMKQLNADLIATIEQGSKEAWLRANTAADTIVATMAENNAQLAALLNEGINKPQNDRALRAFQQREIQGMKLSDRVWRATEGMKLDMERAVEVALAEGTPAQKLSRRVRELLKEPNRLYRRVRDEHGNLRLSQAAQKYHPGTGVYRSSYKNAMRVARTEVNMAYQASDSERWNRSWWVKGIRVSLSNNHTTLNRKGEPEPLVDICDELAGDYPADFRFTGWHPQCRCFATAITCSYADIREYYRRKRAGEDMTGYTPPGTITEPPAQFKKWVTANRERLAKADKRGTTPYFIKDNKGAVDAVMSGNSVNERKEEYKGTKQSPHKQNSSKFPKEMAGNIQRLGKVAQRPVHTALPDDIRTRRDEIRKAARKTIVGIPIYLHQIDKTAIISNKGVKEWLNQPHAHISEKNELLLDIQNVLNEAKYVGFGPDKHDQDAQVHLFEIKILEDESWIIVRRLHNHNYQIHSISDNKKILQNIQNKKL